MPNTRNYYTQLSSNFVKWRKEGAFSWDSIIDRARRKVGTTRDKKYVDVDYYKSLLENAINEDISIDKIADDLLPTIPNFYVEKWHGQPIVPEIWVEKEALADTISSWLNGLGVVVRVNRGYSSWSFIMNSVEELRDVLKNHEKVQIFYLGDYDPSGLDMDRFLREALNYFGINESKVVFTRLAVTKEQIQAYNLPPKPEDNETVEKLARDPRSKNFFNNENFFNLPMSERIKLIKNSGQFIVELDALVAFVPNEFKQLLRSTIKSLWRQDIYEAHKEEIKRAIRKAEKLREMYKSQLVEKLKKQLCRGA